MSINAQRLLAFVIWLGLMYVWAKFLWFAVDYIPEEWGWWLGPFLAFGLLPIGILLLILDKRSARRRAAAARQ